jgi:hypothetical protein
MGPDNYTITMNDDDIYSETVDISSISLSSISIDSNQSFGESSRRINLRNNGTIPIDIWAKLYNNNNIGNDDDEFYI